MSVAAHELLWIAGVRAFEDEIHVDRDPIAAWTTQLRGWGFELADSGLLLDHHRWDGDAIGTWAFVSASDNDEVIAALAARDPRCPFIGPRIGCLAFDLWPPFAYTSDREELLCGLLKEGRDGLVHRPTGRAWPAVKLERRWLHCCVSKYSFDDGAELLTREDAAYEHGCARRSWPRCVPQAMTAT